jgi:RNA polymerase sigma-70 factor (ECF subfamily)
MTTNQRDIDLLLIKRSKEGDLRAFDLLIIKYQAKIIALARRWVVDIHIAEDVAQETFIKAFKSLHSFREDSAFYTWLYRIGTNTAKNYVISKNRKKENTESELKNEEEYAPIEQTTQETPEDILLANSLKELINKALTDLPEEIRTAISLREFEGLSYDEIAKVLSCPVGTVRSRIFRGREELNQVISKSLLINNNHLKVL